MFKNNTSSSEIVPWLQLLSRNAFGNYRTLLTEITLDAWMGKFLDLVNSGAAGGAPNENYPREMMELFSLGVALLNLDGSVQNDSQGPIPPYTQTDVQQLAKALTGWTYSSAKGAAEVRAGNQQCRHRQHAALWTNVAGATDRHSRSAARPAGQQWACIGGALRDSHIGRVSGSALMRVES